MPAAVCGTQPKSAPSGSLLAPSRMQHTSPVMSPSASPIEAASRVSSTFHAGANVHAAASAALYVAHAPGAGNPVTGSTPRSTHWYPLVPHSGAAHVSWQQSPPSKHGAKLSDGSHTPSPMCGSSITPAHGDGGTSGLKIASSGSAGTMADSGTTKLPPAVSLNRTPGLVTSRPSNTPTYHVATSPSFITGLQSPPSVPLPSTVRFPSTASTSSPTRDTTGSSSHVPHAARQLGSFAAPHAPPCCHMRCAVLMYCA